MLKIFSLIEFGERAGSGLSGICKVWEKVFHTPATIEETHNNGVDRTILTLSNGGNDQDVKAMLELYSDSPGHETIQTHQDSNQKTLGEFQNDQESNQKTVDEFQNDQESNQKTVDEFQNDQESNQKTLGEFQNDQDSNQKTVDEFQNDQESNQKTLGEVQNDQESNQKSDQKLKECLKVNPNMTISELAVALNMSISGIKKIIRQLKNSGEIRRIGPDKGGSWKVVKN